MLLSLFTSRFAAAFYVFNLCTLVDENVPISLLMFVIYAQSIVCLCDPMEEVLSVEVSTPSPLSFL